MMPTTEKIEDAYLQLQQSLRSFLRRRLPDTVPTDDLLHDIFVKVLTSHQAERPIENLTAWLYVTARTTVADYYRAHSVAPVDLDDDIPLTSEHDDITLHTELSSCLRPFIELLPPLYRETLTATELEGKTMPSLAAEQGLSVSAIKSRAARGRILLKEMLSGCCHVEMKDGLVDDYHQWSPSGCSGKCE